MSWPRAVERGQRRGAGPVVLIVAYSRRSVAATSASPKPSTRAVQTARITSPVLQLQDQPLASGDDAERGLQALLWRQTPGVRAAGTKLVRISVDALGLGCP